MPGRAGKTIRHDYFRNVFNALQQKYRFNRREIEAKTGLSSSSLTKILQGRSSWSPFFPELVKFLQKYDPTLRERDFIDVPPPKIRCVPFGHPGRHHLDWERYCQAYEEIFSYQKDKDSTANLHQWAADSARVHQEPRDLDAKPYRSVQVGAFVEDKCVGVLQATLDLKTNFALVGYLGVSKTPDLVGVVFPALTAAAHDHAAQLGASDVCVVFEIDHPVDGSWERIQDPTVEDTEKKSYLNSLEPQALDRVIRDVQRALVLCRGSGRGARLLRDTHGKLLDYVQPDMTNNDDGRPMWLCAATKHPEEDVKAIEVINFVYERIYRDMYHGLVEDPYWERREVLHRRCLDEVASTSLVPNLKEIAAARRLFTSAADPVRPTEIEANLKRAWDQVELRDHI